MGTQNATTQGIEGSVQETAARRTNNGPGATLKRKRGNSAQPEDEEDAPRKIRGKHIDYRHLHDPFSNDEDEEEVVNAAAAVSDETFSVAANDGEPTLKEAR